MTDQKPYYFTNHRNGQHAKRTTDQAYLGQVNGSTEGFHAVPLLDCGEKAIFKTADEAAQYLLDTKISREASKKAAAILNERTPSKETTWLPETPTTVIDRFNARSKVMGPHAATVAMLDDVLRGA